MKRHDLDELLEVEKGLVLVNLWQNEPIDVDPMNEIMDLIEESLSMRPLILRLPVKENISLVERYHVFGTPVLLIFVQGQLVAKMRGRLKTNEILSRLETICANLLLSV